MGSGDSFSISKPLSRRAAGNLNGQKVAGEMPITLTTLDWVPNFAQGLVRDLRVRWALEEAGLSYQENLIGFDKLKSPEYGKLQPFNQVPLYQEDDLILFESGAILLHIGEKSEHLLPSAAAPRARAIGWVFAALNSVEPAISNLTELDLFRQKDEWAQAARPAYLEFAQCRLQALSQHLAGREFLEEQFTVGDLMMTTVLRIPRHCDILKDYPTLEAYRRRQEERPAFQRALESHMDVFARRSTD